MMKLMMFPMAIATLVLMPCQADDGSGLSNDTTPETPLTQQAKPVKQVKAKTAVHKPRCELGECDPFAEPGDDPAENHDGWVGGGSLKRGFYSDEDFYYPTPSFVEDMDRETDTWPGKREDPFYDALTR